MATFTGAAFSVYGGTAATNTNVWPMWVTAGNATTITTATTVVWNNWVTTSGFNLTPNIEYVQPRALTEEEIAAERAAQEIRTERYRVEREERERAQTEATARATALLQESLSVEQQAEFAQERAFTVISADGERTYRIRKGWSRNVELLRDGKVARTYCAHPREHVPEEDNMLAQKLFLEADEQAFLRVAIAS